MLDECTTTESSQNQMKSYKLSWGESFNILVLLTIDSR